MGQVTGAFRKAEANADLLEDLSSSEEGDSEGERLEEKEPMGHVEDFKENAGSEKGITLSPLWLHAKPNERKSGTPAPSMDICDQKCQPHQNSIDSNQRDCPTPVPAVKGHHRNEEERETGSVGKRKGKKGHKKIEFPKRGHQNKKNNSREPSETQRIPASDSNHEAPSRGDRTQPSRGGLAYRPKDSLSNKKGDAVNERQSVASSSCVPSEYDASDKRRPRQKQEVHSGRSTDAGFATGRGRSNLMQSGSNGGPLGAESRNNCEVAVEKSCFSAGMFRYPRGKLLDIYRKQRKIPSFNAAPEGFNQVPIISQSNIIKPLALVTPDSDEKALLQDIFHEEATSVGPSSKLSGENMLRCQEMETGKTHMKTDSNRREVIDRTSCQENNKNEATISIFPKANDMHRVSGSCRSASVTNHGHKTESLVRKTAVYKPVNGQQRLATEKKLTLAQNSRPDVHQPLDSAAPKKKVCKESSGFPQRPRPGDEVLFSGRAADSYQSQVRLPPSGLEDTGRVPTVHHFRSTEMGESSFPSRRILSDNNLTHRWMHHPEHHLMNLEPGRDRSVLGQSPNVRDSAQRLPHLEEESTPLTLEEHLLPQLRSQHVQRRTSQVHLNGSSESQPQSSHHQEAVNHPDHLLEQLLKLQAQHQLLLLQLLQQRGSHHHQQQETQTQQLLIEQLLQQCMLETLGYHSSPDSQQQSLHPSGHLNTNPSSKSLFKYKFGNRVCQTPAVLSQEKHKDVLLNRQLQAERSPGVARQSFGVEGEKHLAGLWSIDNYGQCQSGSYGFGQSNLQQQVHRTEGISQPSERSYLGSSGMNMDLPSQFKGLGWQNHLGHLISVNTGQLPSDKHPHHEHIPNQVNLDDGRLKNTPMNVSFASEEPISWRGAGNDEKSRQAGNILPETREAAKPFYMHSSDHSPGLLPSPAFQGDPFAEDILGPNIWRVAEDELTFQSSSRARRADEGFSSTVNELKSTLAVKEDIRGFNITEAKEEELMNAGQTGHANGDGMLLFHSSVRAMEADEGLSSTVNEVKTTLAVEDIRGSNVREAEEEELMNAGQVEHANGDDMLLSHSSFRAVEADEGFSSTVNETKIVSVEDCRVESGKSEGNIKDDSEGGNVGLNSTEIGLENSPTETLVSDRLTCPEGSPVAASEEEAAVETAGESSGEKNERKKWRKGRKMDPRLLGFKVRGCRPDH